MIARRTLLLTVLLSAGWAPSIAAQWSNRYPKVDGYGHHVYLEGYELPSLTVGPIDAVASPDGGRIAYASRGWIWVMDLDVRSADRVTAGAGIDARPAWSPDSRRIAFVRDDTRNTSIVELELASGAERILTAAPAIELDPAYGPNGVWLYFASAVAGDLDLWRLNLASGTAEALTDRPGLELRPQPHPDGDRIVYLSKSRAGGDEIRVLRLSDGTDEPLQRGSITSQARPALSSDGSTVAYNWPTQDGWELRLMSLNQPGASILLTRGWGLPLTPSWSGDDADVFFSEADDAERMVLSRVARAGGAVERIAPEREDWNAPVGRLRIRTGIAGQAGLAATRLHVATEAGHPVVPSGAQPRFDGQTGSVFFYSDGLAVLEVPAGEVRVFAVQGLATPLETASARVEPGGTTTVDLTLAPVWDARAQGWYSGDHHFHLNYGGLYRLEPEDLVLPAQGEALDVATPLLANLHNRYEDQYLWQRSSGEGLPIIEFGQEIRSHFLGHMALLNTDRLHWPWVWGPGYEVYGTDDRTNGEVLRFGREQGGMGVYVHPVSAPDPFGEGEGGALSSIPVELIADAVMGDLDALEVVCLWSNERGTSELWHRLLNVGISIVPTAGTDVMTDFYRTMAMGTTRVYVHLDEGEVSGVAPTWDEYLGALRAGRSFVTTGPMLDFQVEGAGPGDVVPGAATASWTLNLHTAVDVDVVEILVNGEVAWRGEGAAGPSNRSYSGRVELPAGGWIAARALGPAATSWPAMSTDAFAHTGAVWVSEVGSTDPEARRVAAAELLRALDSARGRLDAGYAGAEIPRLHERFDDARRRLEAWADLETR